jgi:hypothetical protein
MSLRDFLESYIFKPLGMSRTYMSVEDLSLHPLESRAQPHQASSNGDCRVIFENTRYLPDTVEIAALGAYSCVADLGLFFGALESALYGTPIGLFYEGLVRCLFQGLNVIDRQNNGFSPCGLYTALDTILPGSNSLNRLISPNSDSSRYMLGNGLSGKEINAFYLA